MLALLIALSMEAINKAAETGRAETMEKQARIKNLRQTLKSFYLKKDQQNGTQSAAMIDRLNGRAVVRIYKVVFGAGAFKAIKEAI